MRVEEECKTVVIRTAERQFCSHCMRLLEITINSAMTGSLNDNNFGIIDFYTYFSSSKLLLNARWWSQRNFFEFLL